MKNLITIATLTLSLSALAQNGAKTGLDLSVLTGASTLGTGITKQQLPSIVKSNKVYCVNIQGKNYLASIGAMKVFKKTVTSRTKSVTCNDKVKRQAILDGIELVQLSKTKMTPEAYSTLGQAMTKAFGI